MNLTIIADLLRRQNVRSVYTMLYIGIRVNIFTLCYYTGIAPYRKDVMRETFNAVNESYNLIFAQEGGLGNMIYLYTKR